jgi:hypothetical protein
VLLIVAVLAFLAMLGGGLMLFTVFVRRRVEAAVPPLGRFVQIGDTRLHIVERGAGPTLVLLIGFFCMAAVGMGTEMSRSSIGSRFLIGDRHIPQHRKVFGIQRDQLCSGLLRSGRDQSVR